MASSMDEGPYDMVPFSKEKWRDTHKTDKCEPENTEKMMAKRLNWEPDFESIVDLESLMRAYPSMGDTDLWTPLNIDTKIVALYFAIPHYAALELYEKPSVTKALKKVEALIVKSGRDRFPRTDHYQSLLEGTGAAKASDFIMEYHNSIVKELYTAFPSLALKPATDEPLKRRDASMVAHRFLLCAYKWRKSKGGDTGKALVDGTEQRSNSESVQRRSTLRSLESQDSDIESETNPIDVSDDDFEMPPTGFETSPKVRRKTRHAPATPKQMSILKIAPASQNHIAPPRHELVRNASMPTVQHSQSSISRPRRKTSALANEYDLKRIDIDEELIIEREKLDSKRKELTVKLKHPKTKKLRLSLATMKSTATTEPIDVKLYTTTEVNIPAVGLNEGFPSVSVSSPKRPASVEHTPNIESKKLRIETPTISDKANIGRYLSKFAIMLHWKNFNTYMSIIRPGIRQSVRCTMSDLNTAYSGVWTYDKFTEFIAIQYKLKNVGLEVVEPYEYMIITTDPYSNNTSGICTPESFDELVTREETVEFIFSARETNNED